MNDKFKFRVWYIPAKNYLNSADDFVIMPDGHVIHFLKDITSDCVIEQCTGLKDKNGNLIYEGDLVKVPDDWDEYGWLVGEVREIYYKDGGFRFKPKATTINRGERGYWLEDDGIYEIVGNIHERKEEK